MIDQSLVQSGFDSEVLLGSRYIKYLLLNAIETGSLPLDMLIPLEAADGSTTTLDIKIYLPEDYQRVYAPNPLAIIPDRVNADSFETEILKDDPTGADLRITMVADINAVESGQGMDAAVIDLFTTFKLTVDVDAAGNQSNAKVNIELLTVQGTIIDLAIALFGITREEIVAKMKPVFDRSIDLGIVGANQNVQAIQMQILDNDSSQKAVAIYVNLKLKDGPAADSFIAERGDLTQAINFLPAGDDIAFGMPGSLFAKLGNDAFQKMAEETSDGSGVFTYPIHDNPNDKKSDVKGKIFGISMYAGRGGLVIDVSGEYFVDTPIIDIIPDPSFNFYIIIKPVVTADGLIKWEFDYDLEIGDLYKVLSVFIGVLLGIIFGPGGFIAGGILALAIVGAQELIVEPIALNMIKEEADRMVDASFFDAIPHRLTVETRRWDPMYKTHHEIVAKTDAVQITNDGIGFSGLAILDKEPEPVSNVVIRTEKKNADQEIEALWYRVNDFAAATNDFISNFPGSDRMEFEKVDNDAETNLFALPIGGCKNRVMQLKLLPLIPYTAKKVQIVNNEVDHILAISNKEISELATSLKNIFLDNKKIQIRNDQIDQITTEAIAELTAENGTAPSQEQIDVRVNDKIEALAQTALNEYIENDLERDLRQPINNTIRFDLPPEKMSDLQLSRLMFLNGFVVINRLGTLYYRDRADGFIPDNLMSLPRYKPNN
jgi:hypothetical protein